ncbi:hypothetical protein FRC03_011657 [Tulasnella sp. 419]|nr:hypothetical protein FRC03_011657 [Tulasnella sp. 419]
MRLQSDSSLSNRGLKVTDGSERKQPQESPEPISRSSGPKLPSELVRIILQYMWNRSVVQRRSLRYCSLVCRQWRPIAQALLFTEVTLRREVSAQSFLSATQANPSLGSTVKSLELHVASDRDSSLEQSERRVSHSASYAVTSRCPSLYRLNLGVPGSLDTALLATLLHPHILATLRALDLDVANNQNNRDMYIADFFRFLHPFLHLSHLRLRGIGGTLERPNVPPASSPSPSFHLVEFSWLNHSHYLSPYLKNTFQLVTDWLCSESAESLRIFEFQDTGVKWDNFRRFLSNHGGNLESLRLLLNQNFAELTLLNLPELCPSLREVVLLDVRQLSSSIQSALPVLRLEHLWLQGFFHSNEEAGEAIDWLRSLPNLRYLTFGPSSTRPVLFSHDKLVSPWKELFPSNVTVSRPWSNYSPEDEDLIIPLHFPRGKTIENLSRMVLG